MSTPNVEQHKWTISVSGAPLDVARTYVVDNPASGRPLVAVPDCSAEDVDRAVRAAAAAQPAWAALPPRRRADTLRALGELLLGHREELAMLDAIDGGFTLAMMRADVDAAVELLSIFADMALELGGRTLPLSENLHFTTHEPYGVVARIGAFNHPAFFAISKAVAPLMAGNAVILKAPDQTPLSSLRFAQLAAQVLPQDLLITISGRGAGSGRAIVRHPLIRRIGFIGSTATGLSIQRDAAETGVKHVSLELGGKNAQIVFADADLDRAAAAAVAGMNFTWTAGQSCGSTSRLLVHSSVAEQVTARVAELVREIKVGHPLHPDTQMGPLVSGAQYEKSTDAIARAVDEGGTVVAGGKRPAGAEPDGWYLEPTVISGVTPGSFLDQTEIFGPVLAVETFDDDEEAIAIANGVEYGLTATIWTSDITRALTTARRIEAGYVLVNSHSRHFWGLPFGGTKASGLGREESLEELLSYTEVRSTSVVLH